MMYSQGSRIIRQATADDVTTIAQIRSDGVAFKLARDDRAWGDRGWTEAAALQAIDGDGVYLIEQDLQPVAMLSFAWQDDFFWGPRDPDAGYLHRLAVRHGFHGLGLGRYAVQWCVQRVLDEGRSLLRLDCDSRNTKLCAYYEGLGFHRVMTKRMPQLGDYVASLYEKAVSAKS